MSPTRIWFWPLSTVADSETVVAGVVVAGFGAADGVGAGAGVGAIIATGFEVVAATEVVTLFVIAAGALSNAARAEPKIEVFCFGAVFAGVISDVLAATDDEVCEETLTVDVAVPGAAAV
jgi:hypothetical protein